MCQTTEALGVRASEPTAPRPLGKSRLSLGQGGADKTGTQAIERGSCAACREWEETCPAYSQKVSS